MSSSRSRPADGTYSTAACSNMPPQASAGLDTAVYSPSLGRPTAELVRSGAVAFAGSLLAVALVLGWRRLSGELTRPLATPMLLVVAVSIAISAAAARVAWQYQRLSRAPTGLGRLVSPALSLAVMILAASISLPGTWAVGLCLFWGILAVEEAWAWKRYPVALGRRLADRATDRNTGLPAKSERSQPSNLNPIPNVDTIHRPPGEDVLQQLTRSRTATGCEVISGWLRVPVAVGQRSASVHVAFCPPFARTPKTSAEQLGGPDARIKMVQLLPYGVRFDLKLAAVSEVPDVLLLKFSAETEPPRGAEA